METALTTGKCCNPAMSSPHREGRKTGTCHTDKTVEKKEWTGEAKQSL